MWKFRWMYSVRLLSALIMLLSFPVFPWGSHYLIMDRVLEHKSVSYANEEVPVEELETFVSAEAKGLKGVFDDYFTWLKNRGSKRFLSYEFNIDAARKSPLAEFLRAARLRPAHKFYSVRRLLPGETAKYNLVNSFLVYPYLEKREMDRYSFENIKTRKVSIRSILTTFVDEPDWGMDHELWNVVEYGYGKQPFGNPKGESSKAPFHMYFQHENFFVSKFAPEMTSGSMLPDRVELFRRLSEFAGKTNHPFWKYRFAAWASHYVQDIAQPYHSKAVPSAGYYYYLKYALASKENKVKIKKDTTQVVANRHFIYEDFVAYGLYKSYTDKNPIFENLKSYLTGGDAFLTGVDSVGELLEAVGAKASSHSPDIDSTIVAIFGKTITMDPNYDLEHDPHYEISAFIRDIDLEKGNELVKESGKDFQTTAQATRSLLKLLGAYGPR
ncbi:phospholipase C/P1 nuclease family protein [Leptospira broomii]|nr:hypothetical protein [Leptospira broomii]